MKTWIILIQKKIRSFLRWCKERKQNRFFNATHFIPMHYGAFALADETPREAMTRLRNNWNLRMLPLEQLHVLFLGQTFILEKMSSEIKESVKKHIKL